MSIQTITTNTATITGGSITGNITTGNLTTNTITNFSGVASGVVTANTITDISAGITNGTLNVSTITNISGGTNGGTFTYTGTGILGTVNILSANQTSLTITGIPTGVTSVRISCNAVAMNISSQQMSLRIGPVAGVESTQYFGCAGSLGGTTGSDSTQWLLTNSGGESSANTGHYGTFFLTLLDSVNNVWALSGAFNNDLQYVFTATGTKKIAGVLERIQLTTQGGTTGFRRGEVNLFY